ncbi:MAG: right-handed parallel beta-helix repeat-containing protein [Bacteroidales bacterium]|nr:right-handed parallel beta-helix repeat-containing protein [Bacteroidales bacterium]
MTAKHPYSFLRSVILCCFTTALILTGAVKSGVSQTVVEVFGEIQSQEWTSDYIYHVTSYLIINTGVELVIRPGVQVKFSQASGIIVNGSFKVYGEENGIVDSVYFKPLYIDPPFNWKWQGIQINRVQAPGTAFIDHARIENAFNGITISGDARHVSVTNSVIHNSLQFGIAINASNQITIESCRIQHNFRGINIQNSNDCVITNTNISDNYVGIWLLATEAGSRTTGNLISGNVIRNSDYANVLLDNEDGGKCTGNLIENNFIEKSFIGIQLGNPSSLPAQNSIIGNVIVTDKPPESVEFPGSGVIIYQDTAVIKNNIFWKNKDAIILNRAVSADISFNSFYDNGNLNNGNCVQVNSGSSHVSIEHNTFAANRNLLINLFEPTGPVVHNNNILKNKRVSGLVKNNTSSLISIINNHWGTTDTATIDLMAAGNFILSPFLTEPDTIAPISPPQPAYKQVVNNKVRVMWEPNPESDFSGYRVHYGLFRNYNFANTIDAGTNTDITLEMAGIYDTVAITAYDSEAGRNIWQRLGHESPFSFPLIIPYAGPDTSICKDQSEYFINQSTYFGNYLLLAWKTSGDGTFSTTNQLYTIYYTGIQDLDSGSVVLTLQVVDDFVIYEDSFTLTFLDFPQAFAGNDTILAAESSLDLHQAFAEHYDSVYWTSTGDGSFSDYNSVNPVYTPGELDQSIGTLQLVLHAISACGLATDTLTISIERRYLLEGRVWHNNVLLDRGIVIAMLVGDDFVQARKLTSIAQNGVFRFNDLTTGNYLFYAVPDTAFYPLTFPVYHVNKQYWKDAYQLPLTTNTYDLDIQLPVRAYPLSAGVGKISGHFFQLDEGILEETIYCANWFEVGGSEEIYCQDGVSNMTVLLYNKSGIALLDYALTDASGNFSFTNLPFGDYVVSAEKAGYTTIPSPVLTLSPQDPNIEDITITMEAGLITVLTNTHLKDVSLLEVFPNPASETINLFFKHKAEESYLIEICNVYNQVIIYKQGSGSDEQGVLQISVSQLNTGIYFGTITSSNSYRRFTFLKK